jgi:hypothetical protein
MRPAVAVGALAANGGEVDGSAGKAHRRASYGQTPEEGGSNGAKCAMVEREGEAGADDGILCHE